MFRGTTPTFVIEIPENLSVNDFLNTPMRGRNSQTGTIYVPSSLIETYKTASVWTTLFGYGFVTFEAIEESIYEL